MDLKRKTTRSALAGQGKFLTSWRNNDGKVLGLVHFLSLIALTHEGWSFATVWAIGIGLKAPWFSSVVFQDGGLSLLLSSVARDWCDWGLLTFGIAKLIQ
jgi:hypothetical protein